MIPKRHYISSNLGYIVMAFLLILILYAIIFSSIESMIFILVGILPILFIPFVISSYVVVKNGAIHKYSVGEKYSLGGKPMKEKGSSFSINIRNITKIEKTIKNKQLTGFLIHIDYHNEPTRINTKTASDLLEEILLVNEDVEVF